MAISCIKDEIISEIEYEIESRMSVLPEDIRCYQNYLEKLDYSIYGVKELVTSYLGYDTYDRYDYSDYHYYEKHDDFERYNSEIEYILDKND